MAEPKQKLCKSDTRLDQIKQLLEKFKASYIDIETPESLDRVFALFYEEVKPENPIDTCEFYYFGIYHEHYTKDHTKAELCYTWAVINNGYVEAMCALGKFYERSKNFDKMQKYYQTAIDHGSSRALILLGRYRHRTGTYDVMEQLYTKAIEQGQDIGRFYFAKYYYERNQTELMLNILMDLIHHESLLIRRRSFYYLGLYTTENAERKKYLKEAAKLGCFKSMHLLAIDYDHRQKYDKMKRFYKMSIKESTKPNGMRKSDSSEFNLARYYANHNNYKKMRKYFSLCFEDGSIRYLRDNVYQNNNDDLSFLYLYDIPLFHEFSIRLIIARLGIQNFDLPQKYHEIFCQLQLQLHPKTENFFIPPQLKIKQYILQKTNMWPTNYNHEEDIDTYLIFNELLSLVHSKRNILGPLATLRIAGFLFR